MAVPTAITDLSATASSNSPAGSDSPVGVIDDFLRAHAAFIRQGDTKASDIASASTVDLGAAVGRIVDITGTTTITSFGTVAAGVWRILRFTGSLIITHNATSLICPGGGSIRTAGGDTCIAVSLGSGNWVIAQYLRGAAAVSTPERFSVLQTANNAIAVGIRSDGSGGIPLAVWDYSGSGGSYIYAQFYAASGGTLTGSITSNGTGTTYGTASDRRLKSAIRDVTKATALADVLTIKTREWEWNETGDKAVGFVADELQAVVPDAVIGKPNEVDAFGNPIIQMVDHSRLVPLLVASVQELAARVANLEK